MDRTRPHCVRISLDEPANMARLLRNGAVWRLPQFWNDAVRAIENGLVPLDECKDVPPEVLRLLRG